MGFGDRDYAWDSPSRRAFLGGGGRAVKVIVGLCVAALVLQLLSLRFPPVYGEPPMNGLFGLDPLLLGVGQVWRLITYGFLHAGFWHIFFNMLWLYWLGMLVEDRLGTREFVLFHLASLIAGGVVFAALELIPGVGPGTGRVSTCVGASGAVMGVLMLCALWDPHRQVSLIFFTLPLWAIAGFYAAWETYHVLLQIGAGADATKSLTGARTAHGAHLGGLLIGWLYYRFDWSFGSTLDRLTSRLPRFRFSSGAGRNANVRLHRPEPQDGGEDDLERAADAALAKIYASGEASLTRKERKTLKLYSERAKAKRR